MECSAPASSKPTLAWEEFGNKEKSDEFYIRAQAIDGVVFDDEDDEDDEDDSGDS